MEMTEKEKNSPDEARDGVKDSSDDSDFATHRDDTNDRNNDRNEDETGSVIGRCGFVAFIGRPNAGKSTLLNALVGEKIAAVSDKPQTTRTRIQGVVTRPEGQIIFVDTPGVHKPGYRLNKRMMQSVADAVATVDALVLLRDASVTTGNGDRFVLNLIKESGRPAVLVLNKIDKLRSKKTLLELFDFYRTQHDFAEYIPLSGKSGENCGLLVEKILERLPVGPRLFPEDALTDQTERALVAEAIRERLLHALTAELPFVTAVTIERWREEPNGVLRLSGVILTERASQRAIILGRGGERIKAIATEARAAIEEALERRVFLELFVKVEPHWRDSEKTLDMLGIERSPGAEAR
jgi:GTPase